MTIIGLGMDIVEISRIKAVLLRSHNRLAKRILSNSELEIWKIHLRQVNFLAKRFAVKEAAVKAFGIGIRDGVTFNQFEVYNNYLGKPNLTLSGKALSIARKLGVSHIHVTLADERRYVCATVIIE